MMRTDHMTMRLLALMPVENAAAVRRLLASDDLSDGHPRETLVLPEGYVEEHGIKYCAVMSEHHGDRLSSYIIFADRIVWHDGILFVPGEMPETMMQAMRNRTLADITGSGIFASIEVIDLDARPNGLDIHTDVESLINLVDAAGEVRIA